MRQWRETAAIVVTLAGCLVAIDACHGARPYDVAAEGAYGAALLRCVDEARSLAESKSCRARVDAEWGVVQTGRDGGR